MSDMIAPAAPHPVLGAADDLLIHQLPQPFGVVADASPQWFDRFYFNISGPDGGPMLVIGAGRYSNAGVMDGYACLLDGGVQRNRRFARRIVVGEAPTVIGPLSWTVIEPMKSWRLQLSSEVEGFGFDLVWTAKALPYAVDPLTVEHDEGGATNFAHFFQPGSYTGYIEIDGKRIDVAGWRGLRDRSWGVRRTRERLGMHLWGGAQLEDRCVAVLYNEGRDGKPVHVHGAILPFDGGAPVAITDVRHKLNFDETGEFVDGLLHLTTEAGEQLEVEWRGGRRGLYMSAAGYDGWHGQDRGEAHQEHERWNLDDGTRSPNSLPLSLVNKPSTCTVGGVEGYGIFETAVTRSASYRYRPTIDG
ncbi:hypothetical protein P1X14_06345 [Sphingomonas sp. AOB5]|uniref:hypothetical protein n=1 Tax=Sphingomonas sp. AOB5 TaxID=3034017 RepID=UPI0023F9CEF9|nr:hypothetical protein [Sphingomonas sp. AOB5]MDF7774857.1 hypothetical protein [Sphingomonas sp. AOB5]